MINRTKFQTNTYFLESFIKVFRLSILFVFLLPIFGIPIQKVVFFGSNREIETNSQIEESGNWELGIVNKWGESFHRRWPLPRRGARNPPAD